MTRSKTVVFNLLLEIDVEVSREITWPIHCLHVKQTLVKHFADDLDTTFPNYGEMVLRMASNFRAPERLGTAEDIDEVLIFVNLDMLLRSRRYSA